MAKLWRPFSSYHPCPPFCLQGIHSEMFGWLSLSSEVLQRINILSPCVWQQLGPQRYALPRYILNFLQLQWMPEGGCIAAGRGIVFQECGSKLSVSLIQTFKEAVKKLTSDVDHDFLKEVWLEHLIRSAEQQGEKIPLRYSGIGEFCHATTNRYKHKPYCTCILSCTYFTIHYVIHLISGSSVRAGALSLTDPTKVSNSSELFCLNIESCCRGKKKTSRDK